MSEASACMQSQKSLCQVGPDLPHGRTLARAEIEQV